MASRRIFPLVLALLLATGVQATQGAPLRALAELRAAKCCKDVCQHGRTTKGAARHCCQVAQDDVGVVAAKEPVAPPAATAIHFERSPALVGEPVWHAVASPPPLARAAPLFLVTRTLRL